MLRFFVWCRRVRRTLRPKPLVMFSRRAAELNRARVCVTLGGARTVRPKPPTRERYREAPKGERSGGGFRAGVLYRYESHAARLGVQGGGLRGSVGAGRLARAGGGGCGAVVGDCAAAFGRGARAYAEPRGSGR